MIIQRETRFHNFHKDNNGGYLKKTRGGLGEPNLIILNQTEYFGIIKTQTIPNRN
ncbi:hypothetical protein LguiA_022391 [Lonicera macranthoides]